MSFDPLAPLRALVEHDVEFILIGGVAANALGSPIATVDLDICYRRTSENLESLAACLRDLEARLRGTDDDVPFLLDAKTLRAGDTFTMDTKLGPLDLLGTPAGTDGYEDLIRGAVELDIDGMPIKVVSLDDLIRMKKAAGRRKDLLALEELGALRDELGGR